MLQSVFIANPAEDFRYGTYLSPLADANWVILGVLIVVGALTLALTSCLSKQEDNWREFTLKKCFTFR